MGRLALCIAICAASLAGAPKRVLYVTHSAGFRHDSIPYSQQVFRDIAAKSSGALEVVATEDLAMLEPESLAGFDVVYFFTSGELPLSGRAKTALLDFVRSGKGFGGVHSATDTLYGWAEYGEMIGGYFNGHPWAQEVAIDIEDPDHPATRHLSPAFRIADEIYQFRDFSRDRVRVLMTLDTRSADLRAPGANPGDDFPLAWCRQYGSGRVFYTALGHGEETWRDPRFQTMLANALLWLSDQTPGEAAPRLAIPAVTAVGDAAFAGGAAFAPGELITISGSELAGSRLAAVEVPLPVKLAGTSVRANGVALPLLFVSSRQINAQLPFELKAGETVTLHVAAAGRMSAPVTLRIESAAPAIFAVVRAGAAISIYATGLGAVQRPVATGSAAPAVPLAETVVQPAVTISGAPAQVLFSGLAPGFAGLYQVNALIPAGVIAGPVVLTAAGRESNPVTLAAQ